MNEGALSSKSEIHACFGCCGGAILKTESPPEINMTEAESMQRCVERCRVIAEELRRVVLGGGEDSCSCCGLCYPQPPVWSEDDVEPPTDDDFEVLMPRPCGECSVEYWQMRRDLYTELLCWRRDYYGSSEWEDDDWEDRGCSGGLCGCCGRTRD